MIGRAVRAMKIAASVLVLIGVCMLGALALILVLGTAMGDRPPLSVTVLSAVPLGAILVYVALMGHSQSTGRAAESRTEQYERAKDKNDG